MKLYSLFRVHNFLFLSSLCLSTECCLNTLVFLCLFKPIFNFYEFILYEVLYLYCTNRVNVTLRISDAFEETALKMQAQVIFIVKG